MNDKSEIDINFESIYNIVCANHDELYQKFSHIYTPEYNRYIYKKYFYDDEESDIKMFNYTISLSFTFYANILKQFN